MKRFLMFLLAALMLFSFAACEFASEDDVINSTEGSNESSDSKSEPNQSSGDTNSDSSSETSNSTSELPDNSSDTSNESSDADGPITKTFSVSVVVNGYSELKNKGYDVTYDATTVEVTVKATANVINQLDSSSITATVDISNVSETGEIELLINYNAPDGVEILSTSANFIKIEIEKKSAEIVPPSVDDVREVNGVVISGIRAMEKFGGGAEAGATTAANLNKFKEAMGNVNVYVLPAPLASAFYAPEEYAKSITRHQDCFYGMRDALVNVGFVDTITALSTHVDEEIYFRTDHHWQALAAYYASEEFAKVAGVQFDNLSTFKSYSEDGILGSFYTSYTHDAVLKSNPDTITWYEPTREHTVTYYSKDDYENPITGRTLFSSNDGYTKFIYGDSYTTNIKTNVNNGRKLLLFKDSYGNALAPFLVGSFEEIIIADYRDFSLNAKEFVEEHGITDVCFELAAFTVAGSKRHYIVDLINY